MDRAAHPRSSARARCGTARALSSLESGPCAVSARARRRPPGTRAASPSGTRAGRRLAGPAGAGCDPRARICARPVRSRRRRGRSRSAPVLAREPPFSPGPGRRAQLRLAAEALGFSLELGDVVVAAHKRSRGPPRTASRTSAGEREAVTFADPARQELGAVDAPRGSARGGRPRRAPISGSSAASSRSSVAAGEGSTASHAKAPRAGRRSAALRLRPRTLHVDARAPLSACAARARLSGR